jgi:hypothetical protein
MAGGWYTAELNAGQDEVEDEVEDVVLKVENAEEIRMLTSDQDEENKPPATDAG